MEDKKASYSRIKHSLAVIDIIYLLALLAILQYSPLAVLLGQWLKGFSANGPVTVFLYCLIISSVYAIFEFPLAYYRSYAVEHAFGLSTEKFFSWLSDAVKSSVLSFLFFAILMEIFFAILRNYPQQWWWMCGASWMFLSVIMARIFPVLIIPLFFKYKRIEDEALRGRILALSGRMSIKILDVYEINFSKKSTKANAALVGMGRSKRVILTDTLMGKFTPDEIEVILAHEFGHFKLRHLIKRVAMNAFIILATFYCFFKFAHIAFDSFAIKLSDISGLGIWMFLFTIFQIILIPLTNWISRNMERNADRKALEFSPNREAFVSMMKKLAEQNLSEGKPSLLVKIFFYDHPPIDERIAFAKGGN